MPVFQRITPIFVNMCTCVYWSVSPVLGTRVCKTFVSTCLLKMLHMGYRCHSVPAAVSRRSSLGVSKAEPSGSIQAALSTSRGKATAAEKKASLSFSLSLSASHSHPNNVPLPFHVLFITPQLQEILLLFNCFQRLNHLHTKSGCHYIKYHLRLGLNRRTIVRCDTGQKKKKIMVR